jgi:hypothetical protein
MIYKTDGSDFRKQYVRMKQSRGSYISDGNTAPYFTDKVYEAVSEDILKCMARICNEIAMSYCSFGATVYKYGWNEGFYIVVYDIYGNYNRF